MEYILYKMNYWWQLCKGDKNDYCGDTFNWNYIRWQEWKNYGMDKTRKALKTSLKHSESCIAARNAILTTSIVMLPRFIVIPDNTCICNISLSTKWPVLTTKKLKSRRASHYRRLLDIQINQLQYLLQLLFQFDFLYYQKTL